MIRGIVRAGVLLVVVAAPAAAQWASDFPGVPRAAISIRGGTQARTEWGLGYNSIPMTAGTGNTIGGGVRVGIGRSYRVADDWELGFDYTLLDIAAQQPPAAPAGGAKTSMHLRGLAVYAVRVGAKFRVYSSIDQEGNGYQAAVGLGYQPSLKPVYGYEVLGDSSRAGGIFGGSKIAAGGNATFQQNPFAAVQSSVMIAAMGSYRSKRLLADAALTNESASKAAAGEDPSPLTVYDGFALRAGGAYRVTRSIAIGGAYWGSGAPPWRDEVRVGMPGKLTSTEYALLFQFGSEAEGGTDLMISSPTGNFAQSIRIYLRARTTR